jgi:hypothetical protein
MAVDRKQFLDRLTSEFPEVVAQIRPEEWGFLHLEASAFRRATEQATDSGHFWLAEKYFRFVETALEHADPELRNALEISYLEELAFGEFTPERYRVVKERMPKSLRAILVAQNPQWR